MDIGGGRKDENNKILKDPENYEDIKNKYIERQDDQLKKAMQRRKVENASQLGQAGSNAIKKRKDRTEHKALKDREILREAKNPEIKTLKDQLNAEIQSVGQKILTSLSPKEVDSLEEKVVGLKELKGRIKQKKPATVPSDA